MEIETSIFLARFWGLLLVILGSIYLLRKKTLTLETFKLVKDRGFAIISGWIALLIGLITLILHNIWTADWRLIITLFGWLTLIKGIIRIGFPDITRKFVKAFESKKTLIDVLLVIIVFIGIWLTWISFFSQIL